VDFTLNVVLNRARQVVGAFAGDLRAAHLAACDLVRRCACPAVTSAADVVVTSSGGYPLDATFYQCVKGMVTCLPAVERGGAMVSFGGCREGIGGAEYARFMADYAGRWREFLEHIRRPGVFVRDQWEFQMQARALEKVGQEHLHFVTSGLTDAQLSTLSVTGVRAGGEGTGRAVQALLDRLAARGKTVAALPEGPYCAPLGV
jgi:nickel-dependent lactate racemase